MTMHGLPFPIQPYFFTVLKTMLFPLPTVSEPWGSTLMFTSKLSAMVIACTTVCRTSFRWQPRC